MSSKSTWRSGGLPILLLPYLVACFTLIGCLQPESTGPAASSPNTKELEDPVLLAGASSSTNWPVKTQLQRPIEISGRADSTLRLFFVTLDTVTFQNKPVKVKGIINLMPGSAIPALNPVPSIKWAFPEQDTLEVPLTLLDSIPGLGGDTVTFSIRVDSDTDQCLLLGFIYSKKRKEFYKSPFSIISPVQIQLHSPRFFYKAILDTGMLLEKIPQYPNAEMSFYIPGTLYHWNFQSANPQSIGPLPSGTFPLQLVVITRVGLQSLESLVEIFEVVLVRPSLTAPDRLAIGNRLLSKKLPGQVTLLSENP